MANIGIVALALTGPDSYETTIVRGADFDNPRFIYGSLLGEITVDRGAFAIHNIKGQVVGINKSRPADDTIG
jgi:hypothetical protein